jgi:MarR family transcriptional regulator, transcriptional regulator for hemolysin
MDDTESITMYQACLLHSRADRALRLVVSRKLDQFNVTMMEWLLMGAVSSGPKDGATMSAVAGALDVTLPQVTALTASLTKAKLLKQKVSRKDRRSRKLMVTATGKKLLDELEKAADASMKEWLADIPEEQLKTYFDTVRILAERKPQE